MRFRVLVMLIAILTLVSCGGGGNDQPTFFTTQILSDATQDGDIASAATFTVRQGNTLQSVFAGIDPVTSVETRAFLDFPLGGTGGVPLNASIVSAALDFVVMSINTPTLTATVPIRIDLVSIPTTTLVAADFDLALLPALATLTIQPPISQADLSPNHVTVDVTALMRQAQIQALPRFQIRILEDTSAVTHGVVEINDTTASAFDRAMKAPLLQVSYF